MTCPDADTFNAFARGDLPVGARADVADHAATCESCHDVLDALVAPERVGRYVIEEPIGAGAMGVVYAARDPELDRRVAIKLMRGGPGERLRREAQLLARLHHPNVVSVFDAGEHDGHAFVAMALVDGDNLRTWLATPRSHPDVMRVILDVARGLSAAHAAGVIHRDVKPDNIFVGRDGVAQVGDFGLAQLAARSGSAGPRSNAERCEGSIDDETDDAGTPAYMASDQDPTLASDQFSLCVTAWEALTGARPFAGANLAEIRDAIRAGKIAKPARDLPARVRAALERGLSPDPDARWPSIDALAAALAPRPRQWPVIAGVLAAGIAVCAVLVAGGDGDRCASTVHELDAISIAGLPPASRELATAYTRDWLALRREVCATDGGEARTRCLDRARDALAELTHNAGSAQADMVSHAILSLPVLADCRSALEGSASAAQRQAGDALLLRLDKAGLRVALGERAAVADVHALAAEADKLGYPPAIILAATLGAQALVRAGQAADAASVLREAIARAEAAHDDHGVASLAAQLALVDVQLGKLDDAKTMLELATAAHARAGDAVMDPRLVEVRALLASAAGDHATAIVLIQQLIDATKKRAGASSPELFQLYVMLSREQVAANHPAEAREALAAADAIGVGQVGDEANALALSAEVDEAVLANEPARATELAHRLESLARSHGDRASEILAASLVAHAADTTDDMHARIDAFSHMLALLDASPDIVDSERRGDANAGIGQAWLDAGDPARAIPYLRTALATYATTNVDVAIASQLATLALAEALVDTGAPREARTLVEPLLRAVADDLAAPVNRRAGAEFQLARALWDDGDDCDRARAKTLADAALRDYQAALASTTIPVAAGHFRGRVDQVTAWLAHRH